MGRALWTVSLSLIAFACGGESTETSGGGAGRTSGGGGGRGGTLAGGSGGTSAGGSAGALASGGAAGQAPKPPSCEEYYSCCNRDNGHLEESGCDAEGNHLPCSGNSFHWTTEPACTPDDVDVDDCEKLHGLTCQAGQECHNSGHCTTSCTCAVMGGGYRYRCSALAC